MKYNKNQRRGLLSVAMFWAACWGAWGQGGVYTCTDAKGRRITADRPIAECADREQRVLSPSGMVIDRIRPPLTPEERAQQEARERKEAEDRQQQAEDRRRERALLTRYPNQAAHDRERAEALAQIDLATRSGTARLAELRTQGKKLADEMEFYKKDPSRAPANLRAQVDENSKSVLAQEHFISEQDTEKSRVNQRFDEERTKLRKLWASAGHQQTP